MADPLVSVVIPTYNRAQQILRSLHSAFAQSMPDLEVVVVDDGSTDDTTDVLAAVDDERLRVIALDRNGGQCRARNRGIVEARGRYIAFLDSDDEWEPTKLERQLQAFEDHPRPTLVYTGLYVDDGTERVAGSAALNEQSFDEFLAVPGPITTSGMMVDKEVAGKELYFDESLPGMEEADLLIRVSRYRRVACIPEPLYTRYMHGGEKVSNPRTFSMARRMLLDKYKEEFEARPQLAATCYLRLALTQLKAGDGPGARSSLHAAARSDPDRLALRVMDAVGRFGPGGARVALKAYSSMSRVRRARETQKAHPL